MHVKVKLMETFINIIYIQYILWMTLILNPKKKKKTNLFNENGPKNIFTARRNCERTIISKILLACYPCYVLWVNNT